MTRSLLIVGCGYLGESLTRLAQACGWQVSATYRSAERAVYLEQLGATAIACEVTRPAEIANLPAADVVVYAVNLNLRATHHESVAWLVGLQHLMERWQRQPRLWRRFILISSTSVYGQKGEKWVSESDETEPHSPSGRICLQGETIAQRALPPSAELIIARLSGIYGPGRVVYARHFLQQHPISADPNGWLNLIHVEDAARAILALADTPQPDSVYNITDDQPVCRHDYWQALSQWLDVPVPPIEPHSIDSPANRRISNKKLKQQLRLDWKYPSYRVGVPQSLQRQSATASSCMR